MIKQYRIKSGAIAADGTATADSELITGELLSVEVNYPANTCTVDLDTLQGVGQKLMDLATASTDTVVYPRAFAQKVDGTTLLYTTGEEVPVEFAIHGRVRLSIASGTAGQEVTVFLNVRE